MGPGEASQCVFLTSTFFVSPGQRCQREPNLRDQVDPTEKYCPSKASKNTKEPWSSEMSFLRGLWKHVSEATQDHLIPFPVTKVIGEQRETEQGQRQEFQHKTQELFSRSPAFPTQWDRFGGIPRYTVSSHRNKCALGPKEASIPNPSKRAWQKAFLFLHWWEWKS